MKLLGFFTIDPVFLFFDTTYLHIYLPESELFESYELKKEFFPNSQLPFKYYIKSLNITQGKMTQFLLYQLENMQFGMSLIYSQLSYLDVCSNNDSNHFKAVGDNNIYIQQTVQLMKIP